MASEPLSRRAQPRVCATAGFVANYGRHCTARYVRGCVSSPMRIRPCDDEGSCGVPGKAAARARHCSGSRSLPAAHPTAFPLVQRQFQHQQAAQQHGEKHQAKQHASPGVFLSVSHKMALLSQRSMPEPGHAGSPSRHGGPRSSDAAFRCTRAWRRGAPRRSAEARAAAHPAQGRG